MNLQPYIGQRIGVTGSRGYIPEFRRAHVTAGRVSPLNERIVRSDAAVCCVGRGVAGRGRRWARVLVVERDLPGFF